MNQEQRRYEGEKWMGNFLRNRVEEGREVGFFVPDDEMDAHYHVGEVQSVERNEDPVGDFGVEPLEGADITEVVIGGGWTLYVLVGEWTENFSEDWKVWAEAPTGDELPVERLYDWDAEVRSPDKYLGDLDAERQAKMREEMNDVLDDLDAMLEDIRFIKDLIADLMMEDITLAEYEERVERREAESGGSLALDAI